MSGDRMRNKMNRFLLAFRRLVLFSTLMLAGLTARAEDLLPLGSSERVKWFIELSGPMPKLLWVSLAIIGALLLICILYCVKAGGKNER